MKKMFASNKTLAVVINLKPQSCRVKGGGVCRVLLLVIAAL